MIQPTEEERRIREGHPIPLPLVATALIDTGASGSFISTAVAANLDVAAIREVELHSASGKFFSRGYPIAVVVGPREHRPPAPIPATVYSASIADGAEMLIGRDILSYGQMVWLGDEFRYELSLPLPRSQSG
jgi:hypothetical protein